MTEPPHGGTVEHPARLYEPGIGHCLTCGEGGVPTYANGRLGAHYSTRLTSPQPPDGGYRVRTCPGWGKQAVVWDTRRL